MSDQYDLSENYYICQNQSTTTESSSSTTITSPHSSLFHVQNSFNHWLSNTKHSFDSNLNISLQEYKTRSTTPSNSLFKQEEKDDLYSISTIPYISPSFVSSNIIMLPTFIMNEPREFINTIPSYPAQCNEQCTLETLSCQQKAEMKQPLLYPFPELSHSYRLNTSLPSSTTNITQCNLIGNKRKRNQYSKERQDDKEKYKRGGVLNDDVKGGEDEIKNILANQTVDQLQNELDFLTNECSTILIILDSLRNAFTANISTKPSRTVNFSSMTTIINFTAENTANERTSAYPFKYQEAATTTEMMQDNNKKWCHQSNTNVEMNREMRIAFDDLTLQVRQLEKKLERLEDKSQNLYLEINTANQRKSKD